MSVYIFVNMFLVMDNYMLHYLGEHPNEQQRLWLPKVTFKEDMECS